MGNKKSVLFVCLGNICRSPSAHGVFEDMVAQAGLSGLVSVDSAGTAAYHIGKSPDQRSSAAAANRGYDLSSLRARQVSASDFEAFDYILAMDNENLANLQAIAPQDYDGHLGLLLDFAQCVESEVPDPYYGGESGFEHVLDLVENASMGLLVDIQKKLMA
ncbi:low molecular weight protein-tyrosine-phosphatase [Neptunomonas marina]|uniref:protein-tyrosine-phosphatase n=1 Tax=Neptunomonas marina TaxID=1815562 RepID=A0A437Q8S4_9GAMM|nr:low molecular weight protein-tyrosine-phosphatase [Neptunomonas marina]RVU30982.1 low molecular weight phosphotyrosine protein phosphatase [Neptunomonas marina]